MKAQFIVARYIPRDIHRYSHASAAAVLLAAALDWDVIERQNKATLLRSADHEVVIEIPDSQNLRFSVFRSWVRKIATHTPEFILPKEVAEQICDATKLSPDHRRVIMDLAEQSVIPDSTPDEVEEQPPATLVSREPYKAHLKGTTTYESAASYERKWSDGHVDYECMVCAEAFTSPKALGGHRQMHIRNGEAESVWRDQVRSATRGVDPDWEVTPRENGTEPAPEPEPVAVEAEPVPEQALVLETDADAAALLSHAWDAIDGYIRGVLEENARLKRVNAKIRSDMASLVGLMQEMTGGDE